MSGNETKPPISNKQAISTLQPTAFKMYKMISLDSSLSDEGVMADCDVENVHHVSSDVLFSTHILILVYEDNKELDDILKTTTGLMGYTIKYWTGFFPVLLIQISSDPDCMSLPEENVDLIFTWFCSAHHLVLNSWEQNSTSVMECIVRYQVHLEKCGKMEQKREKREQISKGWKCPNHCGLMNTSHVKPKGKKIKKTFFQAVRKNICVRKVVENS
jgi:hypothetical protein